VIKTIVIDDYVIAVLMRDLVGHDRMPSAFLVYLHLWGESYRESKGAIPASHQTIAEATGLSKSSVQKGIRCLVDRKLLRAHKDSLTAIPEYRVLRTWRR
jgi:Helix-turn-helix domain